MQITKTNKLKLALGTVQFGIPYGINNSAGIPSSKEIEKIFELAAVNKIHFLDSSSAYGEAEKKIGTLSENRFEIITKFHNVFAKEEFENKFKKSLENLNTNSVYGYLAHTADELIKNPQLWEMLQEKKQENKVKKIGYSLYSTEQLEKLITLQCMPDIVQLPYSLLDRKFESYFSQLKDIGTEIHVRSVFLQGLYLMNPAKLPEKLNPLKSALEKLHTYCLEFGTTIGSLALNFALENSFISRVVIGVDSAHQLEQNLEMIKDWKPNSLIPEKLSTIEISRKELLNPANW